MQLKTQLFIDGKWQDGQSTIAVTDPSDESIIANVAVASDAHCLAAIDAASRAFKSGQRQRLVFVVRFCVKHLRLWWLKVTD
ncbi:MAG: hypothetical protein RL649_719 [Actinomycetota bacterium]